MFFDYDDVAFVGADSPRRNRGRAIGRGFRTHVAALLTLRADDRGDELRRAADRRGDLRVGDTGLVPPGLPDQLIALLAMPPRLLESIIDAPMMLSSGGEADI